jgi:hypothetical protein
MVNSCGLECHWREVRDASVLATSRTTVELRSTEQPMSASAFPDREIFGRDDP